MFTDHPAASITPYSKSSSSASSSSEKSSSSSFSSMFGKLFSKSDKPTDQADGGNSVDAIELAVKTLGLFNGKRIDFVLQVFEYLWLFAVSFVYNQQHFAGEHDANAKSLSHSSRQQGHQIASSQQSFQLMHFLFFKPQAHTNYFNSKDALHFILSILCHNSSPKSEVPLTRSFPSHPSSDAPSSRQRSLNPFAEVVPDTGDPSPGAGVPWPND